VKKQKQIHTRRKQINEKNQTFGKENAEDDGRQRRRENAHRRRERERECVCGRESERESAERETPTKKTK